MDSGLYRSQLQAYQIAYKLTNKEMITLDHHSIK